MAKRSFASAIFALLFVLFISGVGQAIIFPLLNPLFMDSHSPFLNVNSSLYMRHFFYGVALAMYPLAMFFAAPVLGDFSDYTGRKKILVLSLIGAVFSYCLMGGAIYLQSLVLFFIGRFISGLVAGSQAIAQAAIIDISHPERKAHNLSLMIGTMALGWIGGPLIGGFLSDASIVKWFSPSVALFFAGGISLINTLFLQIFFKETIQEKRTLAKLHLHKGPSEFILAFKIKSIRLLSLVYLLMQVGLSLYFSYISLFLVTKLKMDTRGVALFLSFMSLGFILPSLGLIKKTMKFLTLENAAASFLGLTGVFYLLTSLATASEYVLWPIAIIVGLGNGASISYLLTLFSNKVSISEQGKIMGVTTSISSASWLIAALIGTAFSNISTILPLIVAGAIQLFCSFSTYLFTTRKFSDK